MAKEKIGIIGGGNMGVGIGQLFATHGYEVKILYVGNDLERGDSAPNMNKNLHFLADNDVIKAEEIDEIMARVTYTSEIKDIADFADIVFEAIIEIWRQNRRCSMSLTLFALKAPSFVPTHQLFPSP